MKRISFVLAGLVGAIALAGQAMATTCPATNNVGASVSGSPVCIGAYGQDGPGTGLETILGSGGTSGSLFSSGPGINPYTAQSQTPYYSVSSSGGSVSSILLQIAGYAGQDTFGIYDPTNPSNKLAITVNGQNGDQATLSVFMNGGYSVNNPNAPQVNFNVTNLFGFYLTTPGGTFYSLPSLNESGSPVYSNGAPHMVAYQGGTGNVLAPYGGSNCDPTTGIGCLRPGGSFGPNEFIMAWEDTPFASSDIDYNDFIVLVESIHPVPEPGVLGIFGLGLIGILFAVGYRRRKGSKKQ